MPNRRARLRSLLLVCGALTMICACFAAPAAAGPTSLRLEPESHQFWTRMGGTDFWLYMLHNDSAGPIEVERVVISGPDADEFALEPDRACWGETINPGDFCLFSVSFSPTSVGEKEATLEAVPVHGGDSFTAELTGEAEMGWTTTEVSVSPTTVPAGESMTWEAQTTPPVPGGELTFFLNANEVSGCEELPLDSEGKATCTVTAPKTRGKHFAGAEFLGDANFEESYGETQFTVQAPVASLSPSSNNFGPVSIGSSSTPKTFTLSNTGNAPLEVSSVTIAGASPTQFTKGEDLCDGESVAAGDSCTVAVSFTPTALGPQGATLRIVDNASGSPRSATLSGTATAVPTTTVAEVQTTEPQAGKPIVYAAEVSPQPDGGTVAFSLDGAPIPGCASQPLSAGRAECEATAPPRGDYELTAAFSGATNYQASEGEIGFHVSGPVAALAPTSHDFGAVEIGSTRTETFTISNEGDAPLPVSAVQIAGPGAGDYEKGSDQCTETVVDPDDSCAVEVRFAPTAVGEKSAVLEVFDGAPGSPRSAALEGLGVAVTTTTAVEAIPNPVRGGEQVTYAAIVSPAPHGGTVAFLLDGAPIAHCQEQPLAAGRAECAATAPQQAGSHRLQALYSGDPGSLGSQGEGSFAVLAPAATPEHPNEPAPPARRERGARLSAAVPQTVAVGARGGLALELLCPARQTCMTGGKLTLAGTKPALGNRVLGRFLRVWIGAGAEQGFELELKPRRLRALRQLGLAEVRVALLVRTRFPDGQRRATRRELTLRLSPSG